MNRKIEARLFEIAKTIEPVGQARVVACLFKRNKILAIGTNSRRTSILARRYSKNNLSLCDDAEVNCINRYLEKYNKDKIHECSMMIVRAKFVDGKWERGKCKPCSGCKSCISYFGIKEVYYT